MRIKEVEDIVGITKKNIRFYEKEGLLSPGRESENSYRNYSQADITRLKQIKLLRRLNMPINDIRELLEHKLSLTQAAKKHALALDEQKSNIEKARLICGMLVDDQSDISNIDVDSYLSQIDKLESEGAVFMNIRKNDVRKKYVGPVTACVIIIALLALMLIGFVYLNKVDPAPSGIFWFIIVLLAVTAAGTIAALVSRIKEIKGGEENDLGNY